MDNKVFFKIVIPAYNVQEKICRCIDSILNQTFKDYRVVVIDDMSTDDTLYALRQYGDAINVIQAKTKVYGGGARNIGIDLNIPSEYTWFVDSDDCLYDNDVLMHIHDEIVKDHLDMYVVNAKANFLGVQTIFVPQFEKDEKQVFFAPWFKIIRTDKVARFQDGKCGYDDITQHFQQMNDIETLRHIETLAYYYDYPTPNQSGARFYDAVKTEIRNRVANGTIAKPLVVSQISKTIGLASN